MDPIRCDYVYVRGLNKGQRCCQRVTENGTRYCPFYIIANIKAQIEAELIKILCVI